MFEHMNMTEDPLSIMADGAPAGPEVRRKETTFGGLRGVFADAEAHASIPGDRVAYRVAWHQAVADGTPGGLFFGWTELLPGVVGAEYAMTRGHFHARRETAEYYWCLSGRGLLLLMAEDRSLRWETMAPGSLHYVPGRTAHRVVNTGEVSLRFGACWPSDAGHDYESIAAEGFSGRVLVGPAGPLVRTETGARA